MTIDIKGNLSLLTSLLAQGSQTTIAQSAGKQQNGLFAGRLDQALAPADQTASPTQLKAQALAETLSLQMLHASLSLGDSSAEKTPQLFDRQSPQFQSLVKAYTSNQPETSSPAVPLHERPSQLQEMTEIPVSSTNRPSATAPQGNSGLESIITKAAGRYGVEAGLIKAVIKAESGFNPNAVSHAGAQGLMQLMPGTARSLGVNDSFDPEQNVMGGTRFLRDLLKRYNGNLDSALAAYNWGPGNVDRKPEQLPRETRDYLVRVKQLYNSYTA